jgi:hypothetical protein
MIVNTDNSTCKKEKKHYHQETNFGDEEQRKTVFGDGRPEEFRGRGGEEGTPAATASRACSPCADEGESLGRAPRSTGDWIRRSAASRAADRADVLGNRNDGPRIARRRDFLLSRLDRGAGG